MDQTSRPSPIFIAKQLFNSSRLKPLAEFLEEWRTDQHDYPAEFVQEICAQYFHLMRGDIKP